MGLLATLDECRLSARWPPTLRPNQPIRAVSPPIGCYHPQTPLPFIIITQLVSWYSFYCPTEGGRLSQPRHCSKGAQPVPKAVYRSDCCHKHDWPWWDSNLGSHASQSGILPLSHHDLHVWCRTQCERGFRPPSINSHWWCTGHIGLREKSWESLPKWLWSEL